VPRPIVRAQIGVSIWTNAAAAAAAVLGPKGEGDGGFRIMKYWLAKSLSKHNKNKYFTL